MDHVKNDGTFEVADFDALGATLRKMDVNESSLVVLTLPNTSGHRWSLGRIDKLGSAVRKRGGEIPCPQCDPAGYKEYYAEDDCEGVDS